MSILNSSSATANSNKPLKGETIAILLATGFNEDEMTKMQRALMDTGAKIKIVSTEQGLAQGWHDNVWGHYFAVEDQISTALAADYSMLLIPGGQRSLDKLKNSAHCTRFIKGFLGNGKPVAMYNDAIQMLAHVGMAAGKTVVGPVGLEPVLTTAGATWSNEQLMVNEGVLSANVTSENFDAVIVATIEHFMTIPAELRMVA
jgi:protease I